MKMEVNNMVSEEVVDIISDSDSDICSDKPIIDLFKRLIRSENKQHTVLKNTQIYDILQKELNVDMRKLHILEIDIYLTVIKKFLKDWPEWESFDKIINQGRHNCNDFRNDMILAKNYESVKSFLKKALDDVQPLAKEAVKMLNANIKIPKGVEDKDDDPVLEIKATRAQLKHLFFRHPNRKSNNQVFNIVTSIPSQIKVTTPSLRAILNWWGITITIISPSDTILYKHETNHEFKYVLLNKRLRMKPNPRKELDQALEYKGCSDKLINTNDLITFINNAYAPFIFNEISEVLNFVKIDLKLLPPTVFQDATYRRYTNKYPYVRYLYKDVENADVEDIRKYDLQLQETISPMYEVYLGNFSNVLSKNVTSENSVTVQCTTCSVTFQGQDIVTALKMHFNMQHNNESNFQCTNCEEELPIESLAGNYWCHQCGSSSSSG